MARASVAAAQSSQTVAQAMAGAQRRDLDSALAMRNPSALVGLAAGTVREAFPEARKRPELEEAWSWLGQGAAAVTPFALAGEGSLSPVLELRIQDGADARQAASPVVVLLPAKGHKQDMAQASETRAAEAARANHEEAMALSEVVAEFAWPSQKGWMPWIASLVAPGWHLSAACGPALAHERHRLGLDQMILRALRSGVLETAKMPKLGQPWARS